jgi:hypothetical protein
MAKRRQRFNSLQGLFLIINILLNVIHNVISSELGDGAPSNEGGNASVKFVLKYPDLFGYEESTKTDHEHVRSSHTSFWVEKLKKDS